MRDFFADEIRSRQRAFAKIRAVFESFGFVPVETPALERVEVRQGIRFVIIKGPRDRAAGRVGIKDLASGDQRSLPEGELVENLHWPAPPAGSKWTVIRSTSGQRR